MSRENFINTAEILKRGHGINCQFDDELEDDESGKELLEFLFFGEFYHGENKPHYPHRIIKINHEHHREDLEHALKKFLKEMLKGKSESALDSIIEEPVGHAITTMGLAYEDYAFDLESLQEPCFPFWFALRTTGEA